MNPDVPTLRLTGILDRKFGCLIGKRSWGADVVFFTSIGLVLGVCFLNPCCIHQDAPVKTRRTVPRMALVVHPSGDGTSSSVSSSSLVIRTRLGSGTSSSCVGGGVDASGSWTVAVCFGVSSKLVSLSSLFCIFSIESRSFLFLFFADSRANASCPSLAVFLTSALSVTVSVLMSLLVSGLMSVLTLLISTLVIISVFI